MSCTPFESTFDQPIRSKRSGWLSALLFALASLLAGPAMAQSAQGKIAIGEVHTCAVTNAGGVQCWGNNADGQLGDGTSTSRATPALVSGLGSGVTAIAAGSYHTCALTSGGAVWCWGLGGAGQLGDGFQMVRRTPVQAMNSGVTAIAAGGYHTCALTSGGAVHCWGSNGSGQLGIGVIGLELLPVQVSGLGAGVTAITAGGNHTCALTSIGAALCWGLNTNGQLGIGTTLPSLVPVSVSGLVGGVAAIAAKNAHTCALTSGGAVRCWGLNTHGQLGDGSTTQHSSSVPVAGLESGVTAIASGGNHNCALTSGGAVLCWGFNGTGQLGIGTPGNASTPALVSGLASGVVAIEAGINNTCALTSSGTLQCWGYNNNGQVGNGTTTDQTTPATALGGPFFGAPITDWYAAPTGVDTNDCASPATPCTIQGAINAASANHTVHVAAGNYPFTNNRIRIEKEGLRLIGDNSPFAAPYATPPGPGQVAHGTIGNQAANASVLKAASDYVPGCQATNTSGMIWVRNVKNVRVENLYIEVNATTKYDVFGCGLTAITRAKEGIVATGAVNGLELVNNYVKITNGTGAIAIGINVQAGGDSSVPSGETRFNGSFVTVEGNVVEPTQASSAAPKRAFAIQGTGGVIRGNQVAGHTQDMWIPSPSTQASNPDAQRVFIVEDNWFFGPLGLYLAGGSGFVQPTQIRNNHFVMSQISGDDTSTHQLRLMGVSAPGTIVEGNTFTGFRQNFAALWIQSRPNVTVRGNAFTPLASQSDFRAIVVGNRIVQTGAVSKPDAFDVTIQGNTFEANGAPVNNKGKAILFVNDNDPAGANAATFAQATVGGGGVGDANHFGAGIGWYIALDDRSCNARNHDVSTGGCNGTSAYTLGVGIDYADGTDSSSVSQKRPFKWDVSALGNIWGGKSVADMTSAEYAALAGKVYDKADNAVLGLVDYENFTPITTGTITFSPATFAYDGNAHTISATLAEDGGAVCTVTPATVTAVGDASVSATCTNTFYNVSGSGTVTVTKGTGTAQLAETAFTYANTDFMLEPSLVQEPGASCTATPATVRNAGSYSIAIVCTGTNYDASGSIDVTVAKASTQIVLDPAVFAYDDSEHPLHARLADESGTACAGVSPASVRTVGTHPVTVPACEGVNYTAPAANLTATVGGAQTVRVVETDEYHASVADALADTDTQDGMTLELAPGTHSGPIVLTKGVHLAGSEGFTPARGGVQPNDASNAGTLSPPNVVIDGGNVLANGISVADGVAGATISGLEIRNFTGRCVDAGYGTDGLTLHNNLIHHCGEHAVHVNGTGHIADITITNNEIHTFGSRGLVIWNGIKRDVTIQENYIHNEGGTGCCGIELQDGAATGAWVLGNRVENTGDSGMSFIQLTSGSPSGRSNMVAGNEITNTGRFGIEIKIPNGSGADSGDGAIVVEDNIVATNQPASNIRDRAGIAVIRNAYNPDTYPFQVDATRGVVLRSNQVSGFTNANAGYEGYGIVVEGIDSSILNNTLDNNGIGLQVQQGNAGNQDTAGSDWFGRGNAAVSCVEDIAGNSFSGNGIDERIVPVSALMIGTRVENLTTHLRYCSINAAIAAATNGDTLVIDPGVHAENVVVTRPVTILGSGQDQTTVVPSVFNPDCNGASPGSEGSMCADGSASIVFHVKASSVTIADLTVDGINPNLAGHESDIAARNGIMTAVSGGPLTDFVVEDTTVRNIWLRGIYAANDDGTFQFVGNTVDNVQAEPASIALFNFGGSGLIEGNAVSNANDAIASNWSQGTTYRNNTVILSASGIHTDNNGGAGGAGDLIEGNEVDCDGVEDAYGVFVFANYADTTVRNNVVKGCAVGLGAFGGRNSGSPIQTVSFIGNVLDGTGALLSTPGDDSIGAWISTTLFYYGDASNQVALTGNHITGFGVGVLTERTTDKSLSVAAHLNRIVGNASGWEDDANGSNGGSDFENNWWGCNGGPNASGCDSAVTVMGDADPWLVLAISANPQVIASGAPSNILVDLTTNSNGAVAGNAFADGTGIGLATSKGTLVPTAPFGTQDGQVATQLQDHVSGFAYITATFDNAIAQTSVVVSGPVTVNDVAGSEFHADARATCDTPDFSSIQDAIDAMPAGSEILVCPGVYAEDIFVTKAITLLGPQAGVNAGVGGSRDGSDAANEAILVPATLQPGMSLGSYGQAVLDIEHNDVRVDGFVLDGDNPAITSGVDLNGADPDVSVGIYAYGNRIELTNLVVRNFVYGGINGYHDNTAPGASSGSLISRNRIANVTSPGAYGIGILLQNNFYADVTENLIDEARVGIQTNNIRVVAPNGFLPMISGNEVHAARVGLFHNLFTVTATRFVISDNQFLASNNPMVSSPWTGVQIESMGGVQQVLLANNTIDGSGLEGSGRTRVGYVLNNVTTTEDVSTRVIDGGVVSNVEVGVLSTDATNYNGPVNDFLVQNVAFSNITMAALYVEDTLEQAGSAKLTIGAGNSYGLLAGAHQLALSGAAPAVAGPVDDVFVRSARGYHFGLPASGACASGCNVANASINGGISAVSVNGTVTVEAGTFVENVVVNKAVNLHGPFPTTSGHDPARGVNEAIVAPPTGIALKIGVSSAKVRGFEFGPITAARVVEVLNPAASLTGVEFTHNRIVDYTAINSSGAGMFISGTSAVPATDGMVIAHNLFEDLENGVGADPVSGPFAMGVKVSRNSGMVIADNVFRRVQSNAMQLTYANAATVQRNVIDADTAPFTTNVGIQTTYSNDVLIRDNRFNRALQAFLYNLGNGDGVSFVCNVVTNGSYGVRGAAFGTSGAEVVPSVFHNALSATFSVRNELAGSMTIGSNWYGGGSATTSGAVQVADPLLTDPTNGGAFDIDGCGDNTPVEIVAYAGTSPQSTDVDTAFDDLRARVQDGLGGAVMGEAVEFVVDASVEGASATLGTLSGTTDYNGELTTSAVANSISGSYDATASSGALSPAAVFALTNTQGTAVVNVTSPTVTYDAAPHAVVVTTVPPGLEGDVEIVYTDTGNSVIATCAAVGPGCGPVDAGVYVATATIVDNPNYTGSGAGTLTIERAATTIVFEPLDFVYDAGTHAVAAHLSDEPGTGCPVTGNPVGPDVGSYPVSAAACVGTNYEAPANSASANVTPQPTTITFTHLVQAYDGSPKSVVATTSPTAGVPLTITYDGSPTAPTDVGTYAVHAEVTDANYIGSANATFQIVPGISDIALVLNGPVNPVPLGEVAQYAATMIANPALHLGETFGFKIVLSKTSGSALDISDIATMEVFYGGSWVDAGELLPLFADDGFGNLSYQFPEGIPGFENGFPIEDPIWTWNFRFTFATTGVYTTSAELVDGVSGVPVEPSVMSSIATQVIDALPPTDIHLALGGPAEPVEVGQWAEYTGTLIADPLLHVGELFFVKVTVGRNGGDMEESLLTGMQIFLGGEWVDGSTLGVTFETDADGNLVYLFPESIAPSGVPIEDPVWTWNFRFSYAQADVYTAVAEVIPAADAHEPAPQVLATAAISTTVVDATPHLPNLMMLLTGPLDAVELGSPAQYTGTMLAEPAQFAGRNFFVRIRLSKNGGADPMQVTGLARMELFLGGSWQDVTSDVAPYLMEDGNDLVYLFPRPVLDNGFPIEDAVWNWHFRFTYGDTGVFSAVADVVDAADIADLDDVVDVSAADPLASASIETLVIDTPEIVIDLQGPVVGEVGQALQYTGALDANPLPTGTYFVAIRLSKNGGADVMAEADLAVMEISLDGGSTWDDYTGQLPLVQDGNYLTYDFPQPVLPGGFPITGPWGWDFRFTYADAGVYRAEAVVVTADANRTPVSNTATVQTNVLPQTPQIAISLQGPLSGIGVGEPAHYAGTLTANPLPDGSEQFIARVRLGKDGGSVPMTVADLTSMAFSDDGVNWVDRSDVIGSIVVDPSDANYLLYDFPNPDLDSFPITSGSWTWHFQFTYGSEGTYSAEATVLRFGTEEAVSNTAGVATLVGLGNANITIDPASLYAMYDGASHAAAVSVVPAGLAYTVTYEGVLPTLYGPSNVAPTDAGNYAVVAGIDAGQGYTGSASGTLTIARAVGTVNFAGATTVTFDGTPHALIATIAEEPSATCSLTATGDHPRTVVGVTLLVAACDGVNYTANGSTTLSVTPKPVTITLSGTGSFPYDGNTHAATATVMGDVAGYPAVAEVIYDGGAAAPSAVGSYSVVATLDAASSVNYTAAPAAGLIVIGEANVTVTLGNLGPHVYDGTAKAATVSTAPSVAVVVTYDDSPTPPNAAGSYSVVATVTEAGYSGSATGTLVITKAASTVEFSSPLSGVYDTVHTVTATIADEPAASCTVFGVPAQSAAVGTYVVSATCDGVNYTASGSTEYQVTPAAATISVDDVTRQFDGEPQVVIATASPAVAHVVTYEGTGGTVYPLSTVAPSAVGTYTVTATVTDPNHTAASDTATLTIVNGVVLTMSGDSVGVAHTDAVTYSFFEADAYSTAAVEPVVIAVTVSRQGGIAAGDVSLEYALNAILDPSETFNAFPLVACGADLCGVFDAGEAAGSFNLPPVSLPTTWRASSTRGGRYSLSAMIVGEGSGVVYATATYGVDVADIRLSGIANAAGLVGEPIGSSMTLSNVGTAALSSVTIPGMVDAQPAPNNENVRGRFTIRWDGGALTPADPSAPGGNGSNCGAATCASPDVGIEYYDADLGQYRPIYNLRLDDDGQSLFGHFGSLSGGGIPVWAGFNASTLFRTTFKQHTGTYTVVWQVVGVDSGKVYAQGEDQVIGIDDGEGAFITIVSGDGGEATVGGNAYDMDDLVVEVRNIYNNPVPGAAVSFNVLPGANGAGATLSAPLTTDAYGRTSVTALSGNVAGAFEVSATLSSGATLVHPFALANLADADPAQVQVVVVSGDGQTAQVGGDYSLPLVVKATDRFGNPLQGIEIAFQAPATGASVTPDSVIATTDADGLASSGTLTANLVAGAVAVSATADEVQCDAGSVDASCTVGFSLTNTAGGADSVTLVSSTASATVGTAGAYTLTATVFDEDGNVVPGVSVTLIGPSSGAGIDPAVFSGITNAAGQVVRAFDANTVAGAFEVQAVVSGADADSVSLENLADAPAKIMLVSGNGQSAAVNTTFAEALVVQVLDQYDNPVADDAEVEVGFVSVPNGSDPAAATVSASVISGVDGLAATTAQANGTAGSYNVVASFNGVDVSFALTNTVGGVSITDIVWTDTGTAATTYDGTAKVATATVSGGHAATFTYNGSSTAPTAAGDYLVIATVDDGNVAGSVQAILTIEPASTSAITLTGGTFVYDGMAHPATVGNAAGIPYTLTYAPGGTAPVNAGSYVATLTVSDPNHAPLTLTANITIEPSTSHGITLTGGTFIYDGTTHAGTVVNPNGVQYTLDYDTVGGNAPVDAGSYTATLTITDPNYSAAPLTASIVIDKATAQIVLTNLIHFYDGTVKQATVVTIPAGLPVSVSYVPANPVAVGNYSVTAELSGHPNYADLTVSDTLRILAAAVAGWEIVGDDEFTGVAGELLAPGPVVRVFDKNGNGVQGIAVTFTPGANSGSVAQATVATDASGLAAAAWMLAPDAGTDTLSASVGLPGLDMFEFTATSTEVADLAISKTSTQSEISFNELATYSLVVTNAGPSNAAQADILDELPAALNVATATWLCAGSDGAVCGAANGTGDVDVSAAIPVGGSIVVTLTATVRPDATVGPLVNEALVTLVSGTDADQGDNADTHTMQVINRAPEIFKDGFEDDGAPLAGPKSGVLSPAWERIGIAPMLVGEAVGESGDVLVRVEALQVGETRWYRLRWDDADGVEQASGWNRVGMELEVDLEADYLGIVPADGASAMRVFVPSGDARLSGWRSRTASLR